MKTRKVKVIFKVKAKDKGDAHHKVIQIMCGGLLGLDQRLPKIHADLKWWDIAGEDHHS